MLGSYQNFVQDEFGNGIEGAKIFVTLAFDNSAAILFRDKEGNNELPNPFNAGERGFFEFFAETDEYNIKIEALGAVTRFRNVRVFDLEKGDKFVAPKEIFIGTLPTDEQIDNDALFFEEKTIEGERVYCMKVLNNESI